MAASTRSSSLVTIDCDYVLPQFAASFLGREGDSAFFVEANTAHAVPKLMAALQASGLSPEQVQYVIITHAHLDHAGGSQALMDQCPNATLLAHPRAARHLIDPVKLVTSARRVYGDAAFRELYGEIGPIPASRVRSMEDGEELALGGAGRKLRFIHTRGHANHHFCVLDSGLEGIFTGDSFGLAYPALQRRGLFIFPSTSPTDFDPAEARLSLKRIVESGARRAFLTHFGEVTELGAAREQLLRHLDFSETLLEQAEKSALSDGELEVFCTAQLEPYFKTVLAEKGLTDLWPIVEMDLKLNAAGIAHAASRRRQNRSAPQ